MTLSTNEQNQIDNVSSTNEFVQRLTISPLDTIWLASLEGSIEKRIIGYIDNYNTGVRRLDIILLPGEYLMITRKETRDVIKHTSKRVFKINNKSIDEITNYPLDTIFRKLDLSNTYCGEINQRFLNLVIGEENLVHNQPHHLPMGFVVVDSVNSNIFQSSICYRTDGGITELVKPIDWIDWSDERESDDNAVYALIPFVNVRSIVFVMQGTSKQLTWVTELVKALEKEGIHINSEYRDTQKVNGQLVPSRYNIHYPLPEQLFNVK